MGKKKKRKKYPRNINTTVNKQIIVTKESGLVAHINNGVITLCDKNGNRYTQNDIDMEKTYKGQNKTRIITKATGLQKESNSVGDWIKNFDVIYAVDTNTKLIHEGKRNLSIGIVYKGSINQMGDMGGELRCEVFAGFIWIWNGEHKIEPENWKCAIEKIKENESENKKIGLVVDSELGNYEAYNSRKIPIVGEFMLPDNFTLIYASADYSDEWTNQMIKLCDKTATENLEKYIDKAELIKMDSVPDGLAIYQEMRTE